MKPATASRSWAFMATTSRSITSVIRSSPGSQAIAPARRHGPRRCARVPALDVRGPGIRIPARSRSPSHGPIGIKATTPTSPSMCPRCMISRAVSAPSAHHPDPDVDRPSGYAYGRAHVPDLERRCRGPALRRRVRNAGSVRQAAAGRRQARWPGRCASTASRHAAPCRSRHPRRPTASPEAAARTSPRISSRWLVSLRIVLSASPAGARASTNPANTSVLRSARSSWLAGTR